MDLTPTYGMAKSLSYVRAASLNLVRSWQFLFFINIVRTDALHFCLWTNNSHTALKLQAIVLSCVFVAMDDVNSKIVIFSGGNDYLALIYTVIDWLVLSLFT